VGVSVFAIQGYFSLIVLVAMLAVKGFAFVNALSFSDEAYRAAGKQNKTGWSTGLGVGLAAQIVLMGNPLSIIHLVFLIAALVYLADVRPALTHVMGGRRR